MVLGERGELADLALKEEEIAGDGPTSVMWLSESISDIILLSPPQSFKHQSRRDDRQTR
jgi:hypothetical protein